MTDVQTHEEPQPRNLDLDDAEAAILNRWEDAETLSDEGQEATDEPREEDEDETSEDQSEIQDDNDEQTEDEDETDPDEEESEEPETDEEDEVELSGIDDDTQVEIIVDGETQRVSIAALKRLHGQEASLTRKSQDLAATRKQADAALQKADISYQKLLERAEARAKPYSEVDMLVASRQMDADDFAKLRAEAKDAEDNLKFLKEEADAFYRDAQDQQKVLHQQAASECVKVLQSQMHDWGNDVYNDIRAYAVSQGLPQEQVDQYVDPQVIMLLNKARLYDQTKATAETKKAKSKVIRAKDGNKGKKILRSTKSPVSDDSTLRRAKKAQQMLRSNPSRNGDADDIAEALLARWEQ
jgi:hypothetical protein